MDILPADKVEEYFLEFDELNDSSLGNSFEGAGFDSLNSLRNMGSSFIYIIMSLLYCSLVFGSKIFVSSGQVFSSIHIYHRKAGRVINSSLLQIFWSLPLRMIMQQYFIYSISSLINLIEVITKLTDKFSSTTQQQASNLHLPFQKECQWLYLALLLSSSLSFTIETGLSISRRGLEL
ncbi:hypothetical protein FGO68_gene8254 [Halteria grandinella]|uniref:Uncharacterized protein n=1 Tax=Halteria grandinella TaxID=5974 RepID=A0A8J8TAS2_HALGN|nr:hypothetical protein FGO68_gene8254 [Halteria grandinella]